MLEQTILAKIRVGFILFCLVLVYFFRPILYFKEELLMTSLFNVVLQW